MGELLIDLLIGSEYQNRGSHFENVEGVYA